MRFLVWSFRIIIFIMLFGLAIKNSRLVELRLYFDNAWQVALSLVILGSFVAGVVVGVTAGLATMIRQRREISRLKDQLRIHEISQAHALRIGVGGLPSTDAASDS
ncbi:MAG: DUF1049 domain-containing protein [Sterolibacterium sp.]|nr:DUF1049 domain-containing protein [Sterolibacterium sp.]